MSNVYYVCIYIYNNIEREMHMCIYIYIYIHILMHISVFVLLSLFSLCRDAALTAHSTRHTARDT